MEHILIIDRIEEDTAFLQFEDGLTLSWPLDKLPDGAKEGDVLKLSLLPAPDLKKQRQDKIRKMQED